MTHLTDNDMRSLQLIEHFGSSFAAQTMAKMKENPDEQNAVMECATIGAVKFIVSCLQLLSSDGSKTSTGLIGDALADSRAKSFSGSLLNWKSYQTAPPLIGSPCPSGDDGIIISVSGTHYACSSSDCGQWKRGSHD